jgi:hypothetical protein
LTSDALSADLADPVVRSTTAISSVELTALVNKVPALKQVIVLDTCASGKLIENLKITDARDVPASQQRALARLRDRTGLFILAGCAADRLAYEATRYEQGLLTYSLLLGMRGGALRENEFVDVGQLFSFAIDRVPDLAIGLGGIQRPEFVAPKGGASFDIGRLTEEDRRAVPMKKTRPLFVRSNFQDARLFRDRLELGRRVNGLLLNSSHSARGGGGVVFIDAESFSEAFALTGRYRVEGADVVVDVNLFLGDAVVGEFALKGAVNDLDRLAKEITAAAEEAAAKLSPP